MKDSKVVFRFIVVGTLNFLLIALLVWGLMELGVDYKWANIAAYTVAQIHNFVWCKYWIFPIMDGGKRNIWRQIVLFLIAFGCAFGLQFALTVSLVQLVHVNEYIAQFIGVLLYGVINFTMNRVLTFK